MFDSTSQELAEDVRPGSFEAFRIGNTPVILHWSLPVGGLVVAAYSQNRNVLVSLYCCLAYALLVAAHEFGHAAAAASLRLKVHAIYLGGYGGHCRFQLPRSVGGAFFICSAGLLAQLILFAGAATYIALHGWPRSLLALCMVNVFTIANLVLFLINVIPRQPDNGVASDGTLLWQLALHVTRGRPHPWAIPCAAADSPVFPPDTSLLAKPDMNPAGFKTGIEILNDDKTPMDFVVHTLTKNLEIDRKQAVAAMATVHNTGGLLWPTRNIEEARRIAEAIAQDCRTCNQPLVCRAVDANA